MDLLIHVLIRRQWMSRVSQLGQTVNCTNLYRERPNSKQTSHRWAMVEPRLKVWGHGGDLVATAGSLIPCGLSSIPAESLGIQFESGNPLKKYPAFYCHFLFWLSPSLTRKSEMTLFFFSKPFLRPFFLSHRLLRPPSSQVSQKSNN